MSLHKCMLAMCCRSFGSGWSSDAKLNLLAQVNKQSVSKSTVFHQLPLPPCCNVLFSYITNIVDNSNKWGILETSSGLRVYILVWSLFLSSPRCLTDICVRALIKFRISQHPPPFNKIILNKHFHNITRSLNSKNTCISEMLKILVQL